MIKIYLDNCCYNRPFDDQAQDLVRIETEAKLSIQDNIKQGKYDLVWSFILHSENEENRHEDRKRTIAIWEDIAKEYCAADISLLEKAKEFYSIGIKHKDALHLACVIKHNCKYLITTDKKFLNKNKFIEGIEIINPVTFLLEEDSEDE